MKKRATLVDFARFIYKQSEEDESGWRQFGIFIAEEDNDPHKPTKHQITISPYPYEDSVRFDQVIQLFGKRQWVIKSDLISLAIFYQDMFKLYKICCRINDIKAFL